MEHFVEFEDVCKYYQTGSVKIAAADHLNFYVDKGEFCIIVGAIRRRQDHPAEHPWRYGQLRRGQRSGWTART